MRPSALKNSIYSLILLAAVVSVYFWRNRDKEESTEILERDTAGKITVSGQTMGTTYTIVYLDEENRDFQSSMDSLFLVFNQSLSTYISDSELSQFNQGDSLKFKLPYFLPVLKASKTVFDNTMGAFDPTIGPLVNAWGFGPTGPQLKDSANIDQMLKLVGFDKITFDDIEVRKKINGIYLDFSAIAKGYGVDVVGDFLRAQGIKNFLVEIGGELFASGVNDKGELWKVGINRPEESASASDLYSIIALENRGMATSGNYRNYYLKDSIKISHTINPETGYPVNHTLLSATVIARDCMTADAYATAMMVMGTEKAILLDSTLTEIEAFLIYSDSKGGYKTYVSKSLMPYLSFVKD